MKEIKQDKQLLLEVKNLSIEFRTFDGVVKAVSDVSFHVARGEILGIVGESGCGKSVCTHAILQLVPIPPGVITDGEILFEGKNLLAMNEEEINQIRGNDIGMIFQEPMTSLNPVFTVEDQIVETIKLHMPEVSKDKRTEKAIEVLKMVGIPSPESRIKCYPHELSGGMRQRVMIAMSLVCNPKLLIADEPTTALDVTIQAQILEIINDLRKKYGLSVILITHDLGVISETADRVAVMYAGKIIETGTAKDIFNEPTHPYTLGLLESLPAYESHEVDRSEKGKKLLKTIQGQVPDMRTPIPGCAFANRCSLAGEECRHNLPELKERKSGHYVACLKK